MKRTVLLLISHSCNLSCRYCYEHFKDSRKMTLEQAKSILEKEFLDSPSDISGVDLLGGEPLTNFSIIPPLCEWIWQHCSDIKIFIRTNGTLLSAEMKQWFANHRELVGLGLSIDGTPETNSYNRGVESLDLGFFRENWPEVPAKLTVFPNSVSSLYDSVLYLLGKGFDVTGGLAQGVKWDSVACDELKIQLERLARYYIDHPSLRPISPLFSTDFEHAYQAFGGSDSVPPCWERDKVHTYDCDFELLPCHMFSKLVQGAENRATILRDAKLLSAAPIDKECVDCPVRWRCTDCLALNYREHRDFSINVNKAMSCAANRIAAYESAAIVIGKAECDGRFLSEPDNVKAVSNAIRYVKEYESRYGSD